MVKLFVGRPRGAEYTDMFLNVPDDMTEEEITEIVEQNWGCYVSDYEDEFIEEEYEPDKVGTIEDGKLKWEDNDQWDIVS